MGALWNSFKIAFSMYSKIPMPSSPWDKENMRYVMCFLPLVGVVIGALTVGWMALLGVLHLDGGGFGLGAAVLAMIPVAVSGGIHLDGFLDTSDALGSWQEPEKRLEILKDSRAGAFAVIMGCVYFALSLGVYTTFQDTALTVWRDGSFADTRILFQLACIYVFSRALSGLAIVTRPMAKNTGLAAAFSDGAQKKSGGRHHGLLSGRRKRGSFVSGSGPGGGLSGCGFFDIWILLCHGAEKFWRDHR